MSYLRFQIDLAIKEPVPDELKTILSLIKGNIRKLQSYSSNVSEKENTTLAVYHVCRHDERKPCEPNQAI